MDGYRDLRLVLLALRERLIDPDRLARAGDEWSPDDDPSFVHYLAARGLVPADWPRALEASPEVATRTAPASPTPITPAEPSTLPYRSPRPGRPDETATFAADGGVGSTLPHPAPAGDGEPQHPVIPGGRYRVRRLYKTGGLGQVWVAEDTAVGREVALKTIRPERVVDPAARERFVREARVTGRLEHPCVVPLYDLVQAGGGDDGPAYAMRFVAGRTLAEANAAYQTRVAEGSAGPLERVALLDAFVSVCRAVAYAHAHGVLHRDLKGQNVVLGEFGEVFLLDWGLAKVAAGGGASDAAERTGSGAVAGTPGYLAPEIAAGGEATPASDVYGLGAVLYTILTGHPPYHTGTARDMIRQATEADPPWPRAVNPAAPAPLDAVCRKAMARYPAARYASAEELATEVRRFLADEPVAAYPDPWAVRAFRWARRHRTAVAAAVVLLATAVVALAVGSAAVWREEQRTADQKRRAEENFGLARDLSFSGVALVQTAEANFTTQSLQAARKDFLQAAARAFGRYHAEHPGDPELARRTADVFRFAANAHRQANEVAAAEPLYREAVRILEGLADDDPPRHLGSLADTLRDHSQAQVRAGQLGEAVESLTRAAAAADRLQAADPASPGPRRTMAAVLLDRSGVEYSRGAVRESGETAGRATTLFRGLVGGAAGATHPLDPLLLAASLNRVAAAEREAGRLDAARAAHSEALKILQGMIDTRPVGVNQADVLHFAARCRLEQCRTWSKTPDRRVVAERNLGAAAAQWEALAKDFPRVPKYRECQAEALLARAELRAGGGRAAEAGADFEKSRELLAVLVAESPDLPTPLEHLGRAYLGLARLARAGGDSAGAAGLVTKAVDVLTTAAKLAPEEAEIARSLAEARAAVDG